MESSVDEPSVEPGQCSNGYVSFDDLCCDGGFDYCSKSKLVRALCLCGIDYWQVQFMSLLLWCSLWLLLSCL
jgi:hypothetical protein